MKRSVFILGRTPELAFLELQSLYQSVVRLSPEIAYVDAQVAATDMDKLGGTVKLISIQAKVSKISQVVIGEFLKPYVRDGKITFGVSVYGQNTPVPHDLLVAIKNYWTDQGVTARYVESRGESVLSSVVIEKQRVVEVVLIPDQGSYMLGITVAVQDFESWNTRDFARPAVDPHKGMLPPKVARMIANIALGGKSGTLLDPFCGVGTVLCEAMLSGASVIGSDIDAGAVEKSQKNIAWLTAHFGLGAKAKSNVFVADATHLAGYIEPNGVDAIATEPFMGDPSLGEKGARIKPDQAKNILKGLEKLYIGCLREWANILKSGGRIVIALPAYDLGRNILTVKSVVDRSESLGYTLEAGPIEYSRPQAVVRRQFYVFRKN